MYYEKKTKQKLQQTSEIKYIWYVFFRILCLVLFVETFRFKLPNRLMLF